MSARMVVAAAMLLIPITLRGQNSTRQAPRSPSLFVGRYDVEGSPVVVVLRGDSLAIIHGHEVPSSLLATSESAFVEPRGTTVTFMRDAVGRVTGLQLRPRDGSRALSGTRLLSSAVPDSLNPATGGRRVPDGLVAERVTGPTGDTITYRSGALALRGVVWRPTSSGRHPAVLLLHGSGGCFDGPPQEYPVGAWLAARGYVAFLGCRRGQGLSRGQGASVIQQLDSAKLRRGSPEANARMTQLLETEQVDDVRAALSTLRTMPDVDATRIAVMGVSFGGIMTMLTAQMVEGPRAAVAFAPAAQNWRVNPTLKERVLAAGRRARIPVMVVQAEGDFDMGPVREIPDVMRAAGRRAQARVFPALSDSAGAGHGLMVVAPSLWGPEVLAFLEREMPSRAR